MFEPLPAQFSFPEAEERVLEFWERNGIFQKSLQQRAGAPRFVFYEGPPTANGLPHPGHCLTRAIKDLFPRYQTMCGKLVERKAGWDTHGLPVEVEVCKELGIHTKEEIEAYGVEKFVRKCIESVFRYTREWEQMTKRLGFWVNLEEAYVTFHQSYVESVWWSLQQLFNRGLLYQGHKVVWWWAQGGTALSAGEVGEGYRTVQDPSVYVRFPLREAVSRQPSAVSQSDGASQPPHLKLPVGSKVALLVWTTTPWTLISNHFAAVGPDVDYALVHDATADEYFYIAAALVAQTAERSKHKLEVVAPCKGRDLIGLHYEPPFRTFADIHGTGVHRYGGNPLLTPVFDSMGRNYFGCFCDARMPLAAGGDESLAWRVVGADFIDLETGTGVVHIAPAYGEVDFNLLQEERRRFSFYDTLPLLNAVEPNGNFADFTPYGGRWVKDCDKDILRELRERGVLYHQETIEHEYPFCPRAEDDPLIQYARKSWFVRTSQFKDEFLKNNDKVNWLPEHIQEGRFGDFLRNNVDWALSRERYWGTPLPIWVCEQTGKMEAVGSLAELMGRPGATDATPEYPGGMWAAKKAEDPTIPEHLRVHKPYIDAWTYDSPFAKGAQMRRVPEVIDCWWDAGSMPFAQWGFPHVTGSVNRFRNRFPADFISEAIDQTRGWFYGLLAISTLLFSQTEDVYNHGAGFMKACALHSGTDEPDAWWNLEYSKFCTRFGERFPEHEESFEGPGWDDAGLVSGSSNPEQLDEADELPILFARPYPLPYKTCIVLGHVMGEDALKMSKRKKNYKEPGYVFDTYGADAMRWFFCSAQPPWTTIRFQEANIRDAQREFLVRLYNVFSFFNIYANIDGFVAHPTQGSPWRPTAERCELDRWIVSELQRTIAFVREKLDAFENYPAATRLSDFVDALSNWYVRRSRDRFWKSEKDQDKWDAYHTLYGVLFTLSKLMAPFTPFFAEVMYQNLAGSSEFRVQSSELKNGAAAGSAPSAAPNSALSTRHSELSVHLCDYPVAAPDLIDESLAQEMDLVRDIVSLGRAARTNAKLKVRQPLGLAEIVLVRQEHAGWLAGHADLIAEELNIKHVEFTTQADQYVTYQIKPEFKALGPKFGKLAPRVAAEVQKLDAHAARQTLSSGGALTVYVDGQSLQLTGDEVQVRLEAKPGWSAAQGRAGVIVVKTELTPELIEEGVVRELVHHVQGVRKDLNLAYEARITLRLETTPELQAIVQRHVETLRRECLVDEAGFGAVTTGEIREVKVEGHATKLAVEVR